MTYQDERFLVITFCVAVSEGIEDHGHGAARVAASTRCLTGSEGTMGHAAVYATSLAVVTPTTSTEGAASRVGSRGSSPAPTETLELVVASPLHDMPPTNATIFAPPGAVEDASSETEEGNSLT